MRSWAVSPATSQRYRYVQGLGPAAIAPANTVAPVISGTVTVGQTLSSTTGTWTGTATITYAYQWKRGGVSIGSATASTYVLVSADAAALITCTITATNGAGSVSATSNSLGPIAATPYTGTIAAQIMVTAAAASTGASASFTPPANATLVAFVTGRGGTSATATTLTDSLGSIWTKIGEYLGPQTTSFLVTGVYMLATGSSPSAMTVTGGSTITGTNLGTGCQVISCTGTIGALSNVQSGVAPTGSVTLTVSGVSVLAYYVRQTTASAITIPTGYTELGGAHINFFNTTASIVYDFTSPGNQNWTGGGNAMAWSGEIMG